MLSKRSVIKLFFAFILSAAIATPTFAEEATTTAAMTGTRKQLATIIFAGLGGAVLGLSTLSFYGRPQDYMANIAIGFAVGIITGTIYVTFKTATNPNELNSSIQHDFNSREFADLARYSQSQPTLQLGWNF